MKSIFLMLSLLFLSGCSNLRGSVEYLGTSIPNQSGVLESEFQNRYQTSTKRANAKIIYKNFHVGLSNERVKVVDSAPARVQTRLNHDRNFIGVGINTKKTFLTYSQDTNSDLWQLDLRTSTQLRNRLHLIGGITHRDKMGGTLTKSGGSRQTSLVTGLEYFISENLSLKGLVEIGNNGQTNVDDRFLLGVKYRFGK